MLSYHRVECSGQRVQGQFAKGSQPQTFDIGRVLGHVLKVVQPVTVKRRIEFGERKCETRPQQEGQGCRYAWRLPLWRAGK